ncbi:MAG: phosphatase PAP2 family protein [Telluria sp.]
MKQRFPRIHRHLAARIDPAGSFGLHLTLGALAMLAAGWLFGLIASDVVDGAPLTLLDVRLANWFHQQAHSGWTPLMLFITHWHQQAGILAMALLLACYLRARGAAYWLLALWLSVPGGMLLNVLLKYTFQRARPSFDDPLVTLATYSFPSGHASGATLFYGFVGAYLVCTVVSVRARAALLCVAVTMVALGALSRVYLGAHYLSDVLAGVAFGSAWLATCITAVSTFRRRRSGLPFTGE